MPSAMLGAISEVWPCLARSLLRMAALSPWSSTINMCMVGSPLDRSPFQTTRYRKALSDTRLTTDQRQTEAFIAVARGLVAFSLLFRTGVRGLNELKGAIE